MKNKLTLIVSTLLLAAVFAGCNIEPEDPLLLYETEINGGWIAFTKKNFVEANLRFHQAIEVDSSNAEAYSGLAWVLFKQDSLEKALAMFDSAATMIEPNASLFAGHAFVLNVVKSFSFSNQLADIALKLEPGWYFPFLGGLDFNDLIVLKAENFFMLGDFSRSLREVKIINPGFNASVDTPSGIAALAAEIEKLKRF
ncbi:MAG: hypothetical protein COZ80_02075 [Ignavibacteria bacterium CG_4_8_14_3_um_filter_37_9]|nr:tetratricopeptide repeat protein [Ignavibacteria bacterium]OIO18087.1 MAG: hypothetical protein AUJ54_08850 [Ignavibacteria bacterium CG1_02_37_35]PIP76823.1 MAG: hypothetical protein COW85_12170 [Ignavibacteria bacterium CG22_combo_CG10-13_8_21_14_all_37_15]PIS44657.1 MAG: hypothetical protein COT22_09375 [Ignavibacteria bacterium CG08_land_8_20_14_0_20_37_9]PIX00074.1 MAG: hypothetical protein COZ80_02075 [Ignavibacteria bacterium CG_4_8_14_3_um_filter_37_9]PIX94370.1 MAG: hypothetical pr